MLRQMLRQMLFIEQWFGSGGYRRTFKTHRKHCERRLKTNLIGVQNNERPRRTRSKMLCLHSNELFNQGTNIYSFHLEWELIFRNFFPNRVFCVWNYLCGTICRPTSMIVARFKNYLNEITLIVSWQTTIVCPQDLCLSWFSSLLAVILCIFVTNFVTTVL